MKIKIRIIPGCTTAFFELVGAGAIMIWPQDKIIGYCLMSLGALIFLWGIRMGENPNKILSSGGKGGNAKVGGNGIAIGGPGGRGSNGGNGGDAEIVGDGLAAGGEAGSSDSNNTWYPPARSGYEIMMDQLAQPVDIKMRKYGRGGMSGGYLMRHNVVEGIRAEYFKNKGIQQEDVMEDVAAVPLDYVNQRLVELGHDWLARINKLDYEFYIP